METEGEFTTEIGSIVQEDKLTHDERLRLECLAQAVNVKIGLTQAGVGGVQAVAMAKKFEEYVQGPKEKV